MSAEKEYVVVVHRGIDLSEFDKDMADSQGHGPIPARSIDIANPRIGSKRMTHWMITDEEAEEIRKDPRVLSVEIPPEQRDDISIGLNRTQEGTFYRGSGNNTSYVNWGLRRCIENTNVYGSNTTTSGNFDYAIDGRGVDVVIQDSGIDPNHPEWNDYDGNSRLQQIDWYTASGVSGTQSVNHYRDRDGHGTHVASTAAGLIYGWAKGAHVYSQKLAGLETLSGSDGTGISITDAFDTIRLWHIAKTNGRPTVVNMSWGYGATITGDPTSGFHAGVGSWTYGVDYVDRNALFTATGVSPNRFISGLTTFFRMPVRVPSVDAEIEDMIDAGIHICIAAGNKYSKIDVPGGADYNNEVTFGGTLYTYHQGSSPYSENCFMVASIDSGYTGQSPLDYKDKVASYSERGPGTNIFAPGSNIMAGTSTEYDTGDYTTTTYPGNDSFPIMSISGTSMASPQVAGVCAQHLQVYPNLTPAELKERIEADCDAVVTDTGNDDDYSEVLQSIYGAPNRMLHSRYGVPQPASFVGAITMTATGPLAIE